MAALQLASSSSASAAGREDDDMIAFFDVETTAPPQRPALLLEFGAVVVCPRRLVEVACYSTLVRPADPDAVQAVTSRCNGITRDAVAIAPLFRDVADKIYDVLHGRVWAGHNIGYWDSKIISEAFAEIGRDPPQPKGMIDTLPLLTRRFGTRAGNMKMASLADYFGLGRQRHRSLDDVRMNLEVLKYCATVLFLEANPREILNIAANRVADELVVSHADEMMLRTNMLIDESPSGYSGFVEPDDVSTERIKISVAVLHHFGPRTIIKHKGAELQLRCVDLNVRYGVNENFANASGRPKLNIRVDIPDNLSKVLEFCDDLAQRSSPEACNNSEWRPLIKRYGSTDPISTVKLNIPTTVNGDTAAYVTQMFQKEPDGAISKLVFTKVDVAELGSRLRRNKVDAFFSLKMYDYRQNAGIRLIAERLDLHFKWQQA